MSIGFPSGSQERSNEYAPKPIHAVRNDEKRIKNNFFRTTLTNKVTKNVNRFLVFYIFIILRYHGNVIQEKRQKVLFRV